MNRILIVEDEITISRLIAVSLRRAGYDCTVANDGSTAADLIAEHDFDLALLDIMLPGLDGYELLGYLRPLGVPVIFITAKGATKDRVRGLQLGADDYIVKPFSARELVARIKAVLRRTSAKPEDAQDKTIRMDELEISLSNYEVRIHGKQVDFTTKEVEILHLLASNPGRVFDREQILSKVWGYDYFGDTRAVDTQIKRIRQKMPPSECKWGIRTVYGVGYKFGLME